MSVYNSLVSNIEILNETNELLVEICIKKYDTLKLLLLLDAMELGRIRRFCLKSTGYSFEFGSDRSFCLRENGGTPIIDGVFTGDEIDIIRCLCIDFSFNSYCNPHVDIERPQYDIFISIA